MFANGQTIIQMFEQFAPKHLAMEGDKIGLQVGTSNKEIKKVLVTLDVLEEVVDEAIELGVDLIIAHHAVIFRPLKNLRTDLPAGRLYEKLIKHDIAVYIAHTNLDAAQGGINDLMASALGLAETEPLDELYTEQLKKIVVFVPESHHEQVLQAIAEAGAGWIGKYSHCTFNVEGTGTFLPQKGATPFTGAEGTLERVKEIRLETIVPSQLQNKVVKAMLKSHPYEEVAYDIYPLEQAGQRYGLGRIGKLEKSVTLRELAEKVKEAFEVSGLRIVGDLNRPVRKVAVLGGDGNSYVSKAAFKGADVLVTGDIYYHTAHDAMSSGLCLIDPGHNIEKIMKEAVRELLVHKLMHGNYQTEVLASQINTDPFKFL
ncbi:Nif3-like dinuclear metal center hexameric protein [Ammoniphilus sp. 3BR4]|uniref:Nif3-like dinuclear metal center hexameric protein n=1 Tax=Ammoniphilus sp. 3BR4 TaxID=3158265 RepID=UPI00346517A7